MTLLFKICEMLNEVNWNGAGSLYWFLVFFSQVGYLNCSEVYTTVISSLKWMGLATWTQNVLSESCKSDHRSVKQSPVVPSLSSPSTPFSLQLCTRRVCICVWIRALRERHVGGRVRGELALLIQLMKDLCSKSSCLPLSASKFPTRLISPLNAWVARKQGRGE